MNWTFEDLKTDLEKATTYAGAESTMREAKCLRREGGISKEEHEQLRAIFSNLKLQSPHKTYVKSYYLN